MSVTFQIEANATGAFVATCHDTGTVLQGASYDAIVTAMTAHKAQCQECDLYGIYSEAVLDVDSEGVHLSCANARTVLAILGYDNEDLCGSADAQDFLGRTLVATVGRDDTGVTPVQDGNFIDCGLRPGYYGERFEQLAALATEAARLGRDVQWA